MTPARINELLEMCGDSWLGGQRELVRKAIIAAVEEEHLSVVTRSHSCNCEVCERVRRKIEAERLAA